MSLRERALQAYRDWKEQSQRDAETQNQMLREFHINHLRDLLRDNLGVDAEPYEITTLDKDDDACYAAVVDGIEFRLTEEDNGHALRTVKQCERCGRLIWSRAINDLADLGCILSENWGLYHACPTVFDPDPKEKEPEDPVGGAPEPPTTKERFLQVLRDLVVEIAREEVAG